MRRCSVWQVAALILTMCNFTEEVKCTEYMEHCPKLGSCGFVKQRLLILFDQVLCLDGADPAGMKAHTTWLREFCRDVVWLRDGQSLMLSEDD